MAGHALATAAVALAVLLLVSPAGFASAAEGASTSPEAHYNRATADADNYARDGAGETFCWHAASYMSTFVTAYKAWGDRSWLDWGVKYYDYAIAKMSPGPDGYKGWVGPYGYQDGVWCDVHVGDAILVEPMLDFAELVLKDAELNKTYGDAARKYAELGARDLIEKWDARGTWREDGPYGAYVSWDTYCAPGQLNDWKRQPEVASSNLTLPFNKQNHMAVACLKLYRITGKQEYRDKAQKIFAYMKSRFQYFDDHYVWNYWEPFGLWDFDLIKGTTRHWVNVHPYRDYQLGEINQIREAYHTGVVFSPQDIQRIINTNLKVMWNGDKERPAFRNSNATQPGRAEAAEQLAAAAANAPRGSMESRLAGTLWTGLADFDETVRELSALRLRPDAEGSVNPGGAYFRNVTLRRPAGFDRLYADLPVTVFDVPLSECRSITAAAVMPRTVQKGNNSVVFSKAVVPVELEVAVYSADGKEKLLTLFKGKAEGSTDGVAGFHIVQWDGTDPAGTRSFQGEYRIRWTVPDGYREFPIAVK
jgi:hypothetical protein